MPVDPIGLGRMLMSEWDKTGQPLKERGSVLPIGEYEDGSVGLAWPALLNTPYEALRNFGSHGYGEDAVPYNARQAFDAAGLAMTGGFGAGLVGGFADNAVGSAGGRITAGPAAIAKETFPAGRLVPSDLDTTQLPVGRTAASPQVHKPHPIADQQAPAIRSQIADDPLLGSFGVTPEEISQLRAAYSNNDPLPEGWYVHGRASQQKLRDDAVIQATRDYNVMEHYGRLSSKKPGSGWAIRADPSAKVMDFGTIETSDMRSLGAAALLDMRDGLFPLSLEDFRGVSPRDIGRTVRSEFSPDDIVNSAQAFDNTDWVNWLYDRFGADFVMTPDGAVAMHPSAIGAVRLFANAPTGAVVPLGTSEQDSDINPALLEYLRLIGLD